MSSTFHLAIPVTSIKEAEKFYCDLLGCKKGNYRDLLPGLLGNHE